MRHACFVMQLSTAAVLLIGAVYDAINAIQPADVQARQLGENVAAYTQQHYFQPLD